MVLLKPSSVLRFPPSCFILHPWLVTVTLRSRGWVEGRVEGCVPCTQDPQERDHRPLPFLCGGCVEPACVYACVYACVRSLTVTCMLTCQPSMCTPMCDFSPGSLP
ncbi:unnamed protein product [Boreogadus saida]